jgi:hypothetical protein
MDNLEREAADRFLSCPFCGGDADLCSSPAPSYWVECNDCGAKGHEEPVRSMFGERLVRPHHHKAKRTAIEAWNRVMNAIRVESAALAAIRCGAREYALNIASVGAQRAAAPTSHPHEHLPTMKPSVTLHPRAVLWNVHSLG